MNLLNRWSHAWSRILNTVSYVLQGGTPPVCPRTRRPSLGEPAPLYLKLCMVS